MIHTVLGDIAADQLGITLMHEHIFWDWNGADSICNYNVDEVVNSILPYLFELKNSGCQTLVEATPLGAGRDIEILRRCSEKSGINIITNTGAWDGGDVTGRFVCEFIKSSTVEDISSFWTSEYLNGIDITKTKPGFIKIALGDTGEITELQEKLLRAAARTSKRTNMPLQCHTFIADSALRAVQIIEEENLPYDKFIWVHADGARDFQMTKRLADRGIWVEYDCLARIPDYGRYVSLLKATLDIGIDRILLSQDAGSYHYGVKTGEYVFLPYTRIFTEFIPLCIESGISKEKIDRLLIENPKRVLDI